MQEKNIVDKNRHKCLFAIALMLSIAVSMFALPCSNAHTPPMTFPTYAYLNVSPNPVGVGQAAFVNFWLDKVPPTASNMFGDKWQNFTVTVTRPDGTTKILGPFTSDAVGGAYTTFTPSANGIYTFVFNFHGQTIAGANPNPITGTSNPIYIGDYYAPSTSDAVTLVVQQDKVQSYPSTPLPEGYWARPIFAMNTEWYSISGNWLGLIGVSFGSTGVYGTNGNFNPYTTAPDTAHIVWTKSIAPGGLIGGEFGNSEMSSNFMSTSQQEPKFQPIIMNGVLYYTLYPGSISQPQGWVAVDIRTGETLWTKDTTSVLRCGQILDYTSPTQYGAIAYLWATEPTTAPNTGTTYGMYDAMTGNKVLNIVNATSVALQSASEGSLLGYYINNANSTLNMWNSTRAVEQYGIQVLRSASYYSFWRPPTGASIPFSLGVQWSKPMAITMVASNGSTVNINKAFSESAGVNISLSIATIADGVIVVDNNPNYMNAFSQPGYIIQEGYSAATGELLWGPLNQTQLPWCRLATGTVSQSSLGSLGAAEGVYTIYTFETMSWSGYSLATGKNLWGPVTNSSNTNAWSYYAVSSIIAYGNLYTIDFGGYVNCLDAKTGTLKWTWNTGSSGYETPYGIWPLVHIEAIADGKLYLMSGHLYSPPLFHGAKLYCIDATTGEELWNTYHFPNTNAGGAAIADGYLIEPNAYDNQIYCYNKGQSATTVTIQNDVVQLGNSILVKGTVTDQSPGQTCLGIPAAGTPAVSDESMSAWMEYLYMQQPKPTNATGVKVHLTAYDSNGNFQEIGTTTSDVYGNYGFTWTPPIEGTYQITAAFEGSNSYYSSEQTTYLAVSPAAQASPAPTAAPTAVPTSAPTTVPTATVTPSPVPTGTSGSGIGTEYYIAIAAAVIIIVVVAIAIVLRRRK